MDFINKKNVVVVEVGQNSRQVSGALYRRTGGNPDVHPHLSGNDISQGRFPQPRRAVKQYMVQRLVPALSRRDGYLQVLLDLVLPDKVIEAAGAEAAVKVYVFSPGFA